MTSPNDTSRQAALTELQRLGQAFDGGWRYIASAPKDGTWVLGYWPVHTEEDRVCATCWDSFSETPRWRDGADFLDWLQPTHWMPLPAPPSPELIAAGVVPGDGC